MDTDQAKKEIPEKHNSCERKVRKEKRLRGLFTVDIFG
jgi:hypothetical protein